MSTSNRITASLRAEYFNAIKNNSKKFEGRLNRDKWSKVLIGDTIVFSFNDEIIAKTVKNIYCYKSFAGAIDVHGEELIPSYLLSDGKTAESVYAGIYTDVDIQTYGVVIFELA